MNRQLGHCLPVNWLCDLGQVSEPLWATLLPSASRGWCSLETDHLSGDFFFLAWEEVWGWGQVLDFFGIPVSTSTEGTQELGPGEPHCLWQISLSL